MRFGGVVSDAPHLIFVKGAFDEDARWNERRS